MLLFDFTEFFSWSFGILCIILWIFVLLPQFIETSRVKSSNAISYSMILLIFIGDCLSTISSSFLQTNPIIFYTGIFYIIFDIVFILQWFYYNTDSDCIDSITIDSDNYFELNKNIYFWQKYPWITDDYNYNYNNNKLFIKVSTFILLVILLSILPIITNNTFAIIISWLSVISYFVSRIPQIILNFKRKSTQGLSIYTFILIFFANTCFLISILIKSQKDDYLIKHLPWLIGSVVSIFIDIFIFYQFYIYKQRVVFLVNTNSSLSDSFYSIYSNSSINTNSYENTVVNLT
jgi:solute carrier family 66 (lysosomal lysine-arginine transporter), member 1